jgi:uncharacterized protein
MKARNLEPSARATLLGMMGLVLTACHSAPTRFFALDSVAPSSAAVAYHGPAIRVDVVHLPPTLDRIEVVAETTPGELRISDFDHWSAPLGQLARQALSADLVRRLPPGQVIFPHLAKPEGALGISVDVLEFKTDAQSASLQASWVVSSGTSKQQSTGGTAILRVAAPATGATATAQALDALLGQLADRIVADLLISPAVAP